MCADAVATAWPPGGARDTLCSMAHDRAPTPTLSPDDEVPANAGRGLTRAEYDAVVTELRQLRSEHRDELADRLREARASGSPGDNEDVLAVHEEASVNAAWIARLEELLRSAPIVDREFDGSASVGCTVHVADDGGRTAEYLLIGRRSEASARHEVSWGSPVGRALLGARPGQVVHVQLPDGRERALRILDVAPGGIGAQIAALDSHAEAA
jgi:transcription elongation factor GreA